MLVEALRHSSGSSDTTVSQGAVLEVGERLAATVGPGEQDHLLVITDTDTKGGSCKEGD